MAGELDVFAKSTGWICNAMSFASSSRNWTLALHLAMSAAGLGNSEPRVDDERCACIAITSR